MIKTINLNGSEVEVTELGGDNTEIFNNGNSTVYASKQPDITAGGDEVIAIPAGAIDGFYGTHGTVYLLGTGSVELRGVDHKISKARGLSALGGVGTGISASYVDERCGEMLDNANAYANIKDSEIIVSIKEYADSKDAATLDSAKEYADSLNAELTGYIGYTDNDIFGLEADFENMCFTRLAGAVDKTAGADFDNVNAYGGRRRCNLSDSGEVLAYYGDENFKADGSNGQVMVEQPKFYYRVVPLKTEKVDGADGYRLCKARYYISDTPKTGFKVHPAFVYNGVEVEKIYLSAFEGSIYDTSLQAYLFDDEQVADFENDKLSSIAGAKPCTGMHQQFTVTNAKKLSQNRGKGWGICTIKSVSVTQLLFMIEYAAFNSQNSIGMGAVSKDSGKTENLSEKTGATLILGNDSGKIENSNNIEFVSYRGEENLWGNIWKFVDGIKISDSVIIGKKGCRISIYDTILPELTGSCMDAELCSGTGYISSFCYSEKNDWLFIPSGYSGNEKMPVGDRAWNTQTGDRIAVYGGMWHHGTMAGIFSFSFDVLANAAGRVYNSRLLFFPENGY